MYVCFCNIFTYGRVRYNSAAVKNGHNWRRWKKRPTLLWKDFKFKLGSNLLSLDNKLTYSHSVAVEKKKSMQNFRFKFYQQSYLYIYIIHIYCNNLQYTFKSKPSMNKIYDKSHYLVTKYERSFLTIYDFEFYNFTKKFWDRT